ncbi:sodium/proline symporter [Bacillus sp. UNC438CL73TsuS30]|uniref:sodium/proline symporter n=1 Tax=Bacillus sp. UNC438CL73TsuS30 TaxID=1340434 RepID=UPI00047C946D|nr:sodium/proline symporter [Bacillus sp. UNC438CL73TsuS30]
MLIVFALYLVAVFVIGVMAERYISKSEEGFYLGDRNFGPWATAISAGATDTSGWIFIGAAGYAYSAGVSTMWMLPGFIIGYLINWFVVAPKLRREGTKLGALSLPDYFSKKLNDKKNVIKIISSIVIIIFFVASMSSQLTAAGKALDATISFDYKLGLILSAAFVIGYSIFGGYRSVVFTDLTQGIIMLAVLIIFPVYMIFFKLGGAATFFNTLHSIDPILTSSLGGATGAAAFGVFAGLFFFGFGEPGQPHIVQRFLTARDDKTITQGSYIAMFWVIVVMTGSNLLGLIGRIIYPTLKDPEYVFPNLSIDLLHPILTGIVLAAIFSAIQSTFSSQVMVATQSFASDFLKAVVKKPFTDKQTMTISRVTMVVLGLISTVIALMNIQTVFLLVLYSWAGLGASFGPLLIMLLYTDMVTKKGAIWGIIVGTLVTVIWVNTPWAAYLYELIPATVASTLTIFIVSKYTRKEKVSLEPTIPIK